MKKLGFGLIGCGDISRRRVAPAIAALNNSELITVSRARSELASEFAREFGARRWHKTWREMIHDEEVEAVYISTPHDQHAEQAIAAAEAGKHVLCEKPLALTPGDCQAVIEACRRNGVKLGVAYYRHFYPAVARIRDLIRSDTLGRVGMVQINTFEWDPDLANETREWIFRKTESGGGPMMGAGCHRIEVLLDLFGPVERVSSTLRNVLFEREVEDMGVALLAFASGTCGVLAASNSILEPADTLDIYGSKGSIRIASLNSGALEVSTEGEVRREVHLPHENPHLPVVDDFVRAVFDRSEPGVSGEIALAVQEIESAIYADSRG